MNHVSILVTGSIGCGAVRTALGKDRGKLERRFPSFFTPVYRLGYAEADQGSISPAGLLTPSMRGDYGIKCVLCGGQGGIMKTLWDLGERLESGLSTDLKLIPVRQETIEICELFGWNPYTADSEGMTVIAAGDGFGLHRYLLEAGIENSIIGEMTDTKARTIRYLEHLRYIDKPRP